MRIQGPQNLFYDDLLFYDDSDNDMVYVDIKGSKGRGVYDISTIVSHSNNIFSIMIPSSIRIASMDLSGGTKNLPDSSHYTFIKFFRFKVLKNYPETLHRHLLSPNGTNLFALIHANKAYREIMSRIYKEIGFRLILRPQEKMFELQKQIDDVVTSYPYALTSDTLQRFVFYTMAIESNKESTLVFEEPESHAFPEYAKLMGEKIALDKTNQFFIAMHNPYLLYAIMEKSQAGNVNLFATYYEDYETKVKLLNADEVDELLEYDPFFNLPDILHRDAA